jgi:hypothetical protein
MFDFDIDSLVAETLELSRGHSSVIMPDQVPGVIYNIEQNTSTFVLRILATNNLSLTYQDILKNPDRYANLRIEDDPSVIRFFECDSEVLAHNLKKELGNKRFPLYEENIFNVSDPGDSWWMSLEDSKLKIFFKLARTESLHRLIKLGPLGDVLDATEMFNKLQGYFQLLFPLSQYAGAHGQLIIEPQNVNHLMYQALVKIFKEGEIDSEFWELMLSLERKAPNALVLESVQKANLFILQIANIRRFWVEISSRLAP